MYNNDSYPVFYGKQSSERVRYSVWMGKNIPCRGDLSMHNIAIGIDYFLRIRPDEI